MANIDTRLQAIADSLATIVTVLDNHTKRIAALEECNTGAGTPANAQRQCVAPKSVKGTTTSKKSNTKGASKQTSTKSEKQYNDVPFTATADAEHLSIALDGENGYLNKAARAYIRVRVLQNATWNGKAVAYLFTDKASYNAAVKRLNALKGIVPQTAIAEFVANGWA